MSSSRKNPYFESDHFTGGGPDPGSYFYARGFLVRDKDVLYIANAPGVEIAKVLRLLDLGTRSFGNLSGNVRSFND